MDCVLDPAFYRNGLVTWLLWLLFLLDLLLHWGSDYYYLGSSMLTGLAFGLGFGFCLGFLRVTSERLAMLNDPDQADREDCLSAGEDEKENLANEKVLLHEPVLHLERQVGRIDDELSQAQAREKFEGLHDWRQSSGEPGLDHLANLAHLAILHTGLRLATHLRPRLPQSLTSSRSVVTPRPMVMAEPQKLAGRLLNASRCPVDEHIFSHLFKSSLS